MIKIMQIGAADGKIDAHRGIDEVYTLLKNTNSNIGVLFEPNPVLYKKLIENYDKEIKEGRVVCYNVAISDCNNLNMPFYCVIGDMEQASTCNESILTKKNYYDGKTKEYDTIIVSAIDINKAIEYDGMPDYLVIDAEGYDGNILEHLNLNKYPIPKIRFEFSHMEEAQLGRVCLKLLKREYVLSHDGADIVAKKII